MQKLRSQRRKVDRKSHEQSTKTQWADSFWARSVLAPACIALATVAAYANSFGGTFLFDDELWILKNHSIRQLTPISGVLFPDSPLTKGRPVVSLSLAINYALGGYDVWGYHAVNVAIHILAALVLYGVVRRTLLIVGVPTFGVDARSTPPRGGNAAALTAFAVALIWALHPLQTAAVTYIIQRTESLMGLCYLLTLYAVIRGATPPLPLPLGEGRGEGNSTERRPPGQAAFTTYLWYSLAVAACFVGMATKEVMATAPLIVLLYDRTFLAGSFLTALRRRWPLYLGLAATWGVIGWVFWATNFHAGSTGFAVKEFTGWSYLVTQPGVLCHYLRLTVWPVGLCLDYAWPAAKTFGQIVPLGIVIVALLAATVWTLWKRPAIGFLGAWFFVILAPTSSLIPIRDAAFDHRMYLPLAAVILLAVLAAHRAWQWVLDESGANELNSRLLQWAPPLVLLTTLAAALGVATAWRNQAFASQAVAWKDVVNKRPDNARAKNNLANYLAQKREFEAAEDLLKQAIQIDPQYADAHASLGNLYRTKDRYYDAIDEYRLAIRNQPRHALAYDGWGQALMNLDQPREALPKFVAAAEYLPDDAGIRFHLADCLRQLNDAKNAIAQYQEAIRLEPNFSGAENEFGSMLANQGDLDRAIEHYRRAIAIAPNYGLAHSNLGTAYYKKRLVKEAVAEWRESLRWAPENQEVLSSLALTLATAADPTLRNGGEAVEFAERAVKLSKIPDANTLAILAAAYAEAGDFPKAVDAGEQAWTLADSRGQEQLAEGLRPKLRLYRSGKPYHEPQ